MDEHGTALPDRRIWTNDCRPIAPVFAEEAKLIRPVNLVTFGRTIAFVARLQDTKAGINGRRGVL